MITDAQLQAVAEKVSQNNKEYAPYAVSLAKAYLQANPSGMCRDIVKKAWEPCVMESPFIRILLDEYRYQVGVDMASGKDVTVVCVKQYGLPYIHYMPKDPCLCPFCVRITNHLQSPI